MDYETRAADQDHEALRLWLRLLTCSKLIEGEVRRSLHAEFECTLPRFDLLAQLDREPEGLSMGTLSRRMMVTGGNVTGIADQLEKDGFLARSPAPEDRRQILIQLTAKGRREFARMAHAHEGWIIALFAGISDTQRRHLYDLLGELKSSMLEKAG
ncbi:MAG: MarR family transcriptional regulator [Burkholderiaceae bacterium]|jgi:DNA-binding MarR family transcriptional regulator